MRCNFDEEFIQKYNDNCISDESKKVFEDHLTACNKCRILMEGDAVLLGILNEELPKSKVPVDSILSKIDTGAYKHGEKGYKKKIFAFKIKRSLKIVVPLIASAAIIIFFVNNPLIISKIIGQYRNPEKIVSYDGNGTVGISGNGEITTGDNQKSNGSSKDKKTDKNKKNPDGNKLKDNTLDPALYNKILTNGNSSTSAFKLNDIPQNGGNCAVIKSDGTVWMWGLNNCGQLGDGTTLNSLGPKQVKNLSDVISVSCGSEHTVALKKDGTVWAWGGDDMGQLGDGSQKNKLKPIKVVNLDNIISVSAGAYYCLALKDDGTVWGWGQNTSGQLGDGTVENKNTPQKVEGLENITSIFAGTAYCFALSEDGSVWSWGSNPNGELGIGASGNYETRPVKLDGISDVTALSTGGENILAMKSDGTVYTWGIDTFQADGKPVIEQITGLTDVVAVSVGAEHYMVLKSDGTVWTWGKNNFGELGDASSPDRTEPQQVAEIDDVAAISASNGYSLVLKNDGTFWSWGISGTGQIENQQSVDTFRQINFE